MFLVFASSWKSSCFVCSSYCFITHMKELHDHCKSTIIFNVECFYSIEPGSLYPQHQVIMVLSQTPKLSGMIRLGLCSSDASLAVMESWRRRA